MNNFYWLIIVFCLFVSYGCESSSTDLAQPTPSLKTAYEPSFFIGAAAGTSHILGEDSAALQLLQQEFNALTAENDMKWMHIHPQPDSFHFDIADRFIQLCLDNDMYAVGHTLVWHSQLADWVQEVEDSAAMAKVLQHHIATIVGRYKGRIKAWDVVNEALNEDGTLRSSIFYDLMGEAYIEEAFKQAAIADPEAELIYNDYNMWKPEKRAGAIRLVKNLQEKGIKIDGVGMQGHWSLVGPDLVDIENSIREYAALGVKVHITELDITVLPNPWDLEGAAVEQNFDAYIGDERMDAYRQGLPDSVQQQLAERYTGAFKIFLKYREDIKRVSFWGIHDGHSWLNGWPIQGRTNHPLLFDRTYQPKLAYQQLLDLP